MSAQKPRKWIADEIARLDPNTDYDQIMKLAVLYRADDAFFDIIYAISMPNVTITNHGALSVFREGRGKAIKHPELRMDHTARHHLIWMEFGADHENTRRSIDSLNNLHRFWAKRHPEAFEPHEDYIYALAYEVGMVDRLARRVGAPGLSAIEKQAAYAFYSRVVRHFRHVHTGQMPEGWPDSYEGCIAFAEEYESRHRPPHKYTELVDEHLLSSFGKRYFPGPLQGFGRDLMVSIASPETMRSIGIRMPSPFKQALCRRLFRTIMWFGTQVKRDETSHIGERIRARTGMTVDDYVNSVLGGIKYQPAPQTTSVDAAVAGH